MVILKPEYSYLWEMYLDIKKGCENIDYVSIEAYQRLNGLPMQYWEISLMLDIDLLRRSN